MKNDDDESIVVHGIRVTVGLSEDRVLRNMLKECIGPEPKAQWEDPRVQVVYGILVDGLRPPQPDEHWEGYDARRIVDALFPGGL